MNSFHSPWSLERSVVSKPLKLFVGEKVALARAARPAGQARPPQFEALVAAAEKGDWPAMREIFAQWHAAAMKWEPFWELRPSEFLIALELEAAFELLADGLEDYVAQLGQDILAAIPPGSVLFCNHGIRGVIEVMGKSNANGDPLFLLSPEALAGNGSLEYWRNLYGDRINVPTDEDGARCYNEYREDARRRLQENTLRGAKLVSQREIQRGVPVASECANFIGPGEFVTEDEVEGRVQFGNVISNMAINGRISRLLFDRNPDREFFLERGFPIEWMWPHLSPHGLIMRIHRSPLVELAEQLVWQDHDHWTRYIAPMIGEWLERETPVAEFAGRIEKLHMNHDFTDFKGDPRFVQNHPTQRMFSMLRRGTGDLYAWRARNARTPNERSRMVKAGDLAYRQAFALGPQNPEVVFGYATLLISEKRIRDALLVTDIAMKLQPDADFARSNHREMLAGLREQLRRMKG